MAALQHPIVSGAVCGVSSAGHGIKWCDPNVSVNCILPEMLPDDLSKLPEKRGIIR